MAVAAAIELSGIEKSFGGVRAVVDSDTAPGRVGGKDQVIQFNFLHVLETRDGPVGPVRAGVAVIHGPLAAKQPETRPPNILLEEEGIADVEVCVRGKAFDVHCPGS